MVDIGFSTGCINDPSVSIIDKTSLYSSLGASAIELYFSEPSETVSFVTPRLVNELRKFNYVSIHAPRKGIRYKQSPTSDMVIENLKRLCERTPVQGIVLHPSLVEDFGYLEDSRLPFLIENENASNNSNRWKLAEHFKGLANNCNLGFVLDLYHAYQNDPSMKLAEDFVSVFGDRLKHMHVSGCAENNARCPVHIAKNRDAISRILEMDIKVPKVIEGLLIGDIVQTASEELALLRSYEYSSER